ncbi:MAG: Gfo/Idh/MocA family oxidoreductase, partial [Armatimonadota bacterium]|nr:Gfo/Idh/MocA family oxidoreductase [Armatimonadota bacterium]
LMAKYGWKTEDEARQHVKVYAGQYEEMLEDPNIEGVIIALPLHLHAPAAVAAMKARRHVLTEKLMAHSVRECKEMARFADLTGLHLATGHQRHYSILYENAVELIRSGLLGDVHYISAQWHRGNLPHKDSWKMPLPPGVKSLEEDPDADVRGEALAALPALANAAHLPALVDLLTRVSDDKTRQGVEQAIVAAGATADPETRAAPLLAALPAASGGARPSLLRLLGKSGSPRALVALRAAFRDPSPEARDAALTGLCEWPDATVADDLLAILRGDGTPEERSRAYRAYVRVLSTVPNRSPEESLRLYQEVLSLAPLPEDRAAVLSALGSVPLLEALRLVEPFLDDAALREAAAAAVVKIAGPVSGTDRAAAVSALEKVLRVTYDGNVSRAAQDALDRITQYDDYIMEWMAAGPYLEEGKDGEALHDVAFPPETARSAGVKWFPVSCGTDPRWPWGVDLNATPMKGEHRVAYLRAEVWSPRKQDVRLEVGSDDGLKVWLNGKLLLDRNVSRALQVGQDKVDATLEEGWNVLLLKVTNRGTQWGACARLRTRDGKKLTELKTRAR